MRRKLLIFLIVLLILSVLYIFFGKAIFSDPEQIYKYRKMSDIEFIAIYGEDTTELRRDRGTWLLPTGETADEIAVGNVFYAIENTEVTGISRSSLPRDSGRTVILSTGKRNKKFRVYPAERGIRIASSEEGKNYYLGLGNNEGPGLYKVFNDDPEYWEARKLLTFDARDIVSIEVIPEDPEDAFRIEQTGDSLIFLHNDKEIRVNPDSYEKLVMYFSFFTDLYTVSRVKNSELLEKMKLETPWYTVIVQEGESGLHNFRFFRGEDIHSVRNIFEGYLVYNHSGYFKINFSEVDLWFAKYTDFVDE